MTNAFPALAKARPKSVNITDATLRDFSGGLQIVDDDIALKSKYSTILDNILVNNDLSQILRFGTKEIATTAADVIGIYYFAGYLIAVLSSGVIQKITIAGVVTTIWSGWTAGATHVDFTEKGGFLIVTNNQDKPVLIDQSIVASFLKDIGTGSNINTPICKHFTTVGNYVVGAFDGVNPEIIISNNGTSGTWPGDPAPNDATRFNLGGYVSASNGRISGLHSFKNKLIVFFYNAVVVVQLGTYNASGQHVPTVVDTIFNVGSLSHRSVTINEQDFYFITSSGVYSVNKNTFGETFRSVERSAAIRKMFIKNLPAATTLENVDAFSVEDRTHNRVFYFVKRLDGTKFMLSMTYSNTSNEVNWSTLSGWDFDGGCATEQKRVFFFKNNKVYQYGNDVFAGENYYADYITAANPIGVDINFDWETPWLDANMRLKKKKLLYVSGDTGGTATFDLSIFVDKFYKDVTAALTPALKMRLRAGDATGYGFPSVGYGGGRRFSDERGLGFPVEFKLIKLKLTGATKEPLRFSAISMIYQIRGYKR